MNKIYFKGNPYSNGHKIIEFKWSGRLEKDIGLVFDFHLKTESYEASDNSDNQEEGEDSDWKSKPVWCNYGRCTMSSTFWDGNGIVVGNKQRKFNFNDLLNSSIITDPLPEANDYDNEDLAFNIYLLGHDDCANHEISFTKQYDDFTYDINWKGNIALAYAGDYEYKYLFEATIKRVKFDGISIDKNLNKKENENLLTSYSIGYSKYELIGDKFKLH